MDAAPVAGTPTEERLADLLTEEAQRQLVASFRGELRQRAERMFTHAFQAALADGAADEILTSLRASFDTAAEAVATARDLIPTEAPAEQFLADAKPAAIAAWQQLDGHIATLEQIGRRIAATFGPRNGHFPLIEEYALGDGFRLHDAAIFCTDGPNLESDSRAFRQPDRGHRTSPWFRTIPVKLHTVDSARDRYRQWASGEWQRLNAGPPTSYLDENGRMHQLRGPRILSPHRNWPRADHRQHRGRHEQEVTHGVHRRRVSSPYFLKTSKIANGIKKAFREVDDDAPEAEDGEGR